MLFNLTEYGTPLVSVFSVFLFIPLSLFIYYIVPVAKRQIALIAISACFMIFISPIQLVTISSLILVNYVFAREITEASITQKKYATFVMILSIVTNILVWLFFNLRTNLIGYSYLFGGAVVPFLLIDTNLKIYRKSISQMPSLTGYLSHASFFGRLSVGPFNTVNDYKHKIIDDSISVNLKKGFALFSVGMFQFLFLGVRLVQLAEIIASFNIKDTTAPSLWLMGGCLALGCYYTLKGVRTLSEGICNLFGLKLPSRWNPLLGNDTLFGFSTNFHGSLEHLIWNFFRIKLGNSRYVFIVKIFTALITGILLGLWIDFSLTFLILGLFIAICAILEYYIFRYWLKTSPKVLHKLFLALVLVVSLTLLICGYLGWNPEFFKILYGFGSVSVNYSAYNKISYYLNSYLFVIIVSIFCATKLPDKINDYFTKYLSKGYGVVQNISYVLLFLFSVTLVF